MTTTGKLAEALAAFQAEAPRVSKDKTATVPMKAGGKYSYAYADLADVAAAAYPLLAKHGLAFSCCPRSADRGYELAGLLMHSSGESIEGALPLHGTTPQELGSAITYARRYLLGAMTGIVTDTDDDGALAQHAPRQQRAPRPEPVAAPDAETGEAMADKTRARMFALFTAHVPPITDPQKQRDGIARIIGRPIASRSELTEREARAVCASLEGKS